MIAAPEMVAQKVDENQNYAQCSCNSDGEVR